MQPFVKLASKVQKPLGDMIHLQCKAAYRVDHWDCMLIKVSLLCDTYGVLQVLSKCFWTDLAR